MHDPLVHEKLDTILEEQRHIRRMLVRMGLAEVSLMSTNAEVQAAIAALKAQVTENVSEEQSAKTLILGIPAMIESAVAKAVAANPTFDASDLLGLASELKTSAGDLSGAVVANTPAATPTPAADPTPAATPTEPAPPAPDAPPAA